MSETTNHDIITTFTIPQTAESENHPVTVIPNLATDGMRAEVFKILGQYFDGSRDSHNVIVRLSSISHRAQDYEAEILSVIRYGRQALKEIDISNRRILKALGRPSKGKS